ncbi:hypothetical protein PF006_g31671 [Phytophthora fragariae]|uniref:Uncharacterized protein n=1 Tax=Phytophthora fragariae TaxID=53985 RepID=A0A6A3PH48_9STRA|nr:hypothetical protein PF003_g32974 [Phytophthora fragariae]KAE9060305.1 hypothetical protein PF006_g31671 [Phytophthora fragariae]
MTRLVASALLAYCRCMTTHKYFEGKRDLFGQLSCLGLSIAKDQMCSSGFA